MLNVQLMHRRILECFLILCELKIIKAQGEVLNLNKFIQTVASCQRRQTSTITRNGFEFSGFCTSKCAVI